ncbi:toxin-antitoxin system YwqK family antitoxin [Parapedobacter koreensis]|uniref:MORN repeat variant n=1 Tax=Parapedobacter koreensis TaxID=332977 RepID=A0A1H7T556_9SPHI|nr:hypothetical protein [Parapedobacter koreensis]SEL79444.1 MORN repeat variant [Parapedobacter koreensis]
MDNQLIGRLLIGLMLLVPQVTFANDRDTVPAKPIYYEKAPHGMTRFFYDDHYFLADKDCQFKAIERVAAYDFEAQVFVGEFTDFNNWGRAILRGNYRNGKKDGAFKAYHPNGQLKWEVSYMQDRPRGLWKYYYPDGKPLLEVMYDDEKVLIRNFWDQRGRQRVVDGNGRYDFAIDTDGYNPFGYMRYSRKGKVVDGFPDGVWTITYLFEDGNTEGAGHELYQKGRFIRGYETYEDREFHDAPKYGILPTSFFVRADLMIGKGCTIDEYSGFTNYLSEHLEEWFDGELDEMPDPVQIEFSIVVRKNGAPERAEMEATFGQKQYADLLLAGLSWVSFWFPSYADGAYIDDKLTVTMEAFPDAAERKLRFYNVTIQREKGI